MANPRLLILTAAAAAFLAGPMAETASAQSAAHRHIGHVGDMFNGTPDNVGLLAAAQAEAEVAAAHAGYAAGSEDLGGIQRHTTHVLHALDASTSERGPGKGYGLIRAASGCAQHIGMAGESDDASGAVKTHSTHVKTSCAERGGVGREPLRKRLLRWPPRPTWRRRRRSPTRSRPSPRPSSRVRTPTATDASPGVKAKAAWSRRPRTCGS